MMSSELGLNLTQSPCDGEHYKVLRILYPVLDLILMISIIVGNVLVIVVTARTPSLRTVSGCFIIQLSVADISLGISLLLNAVVNINRSVSLQILNHILIPKKYYTIRVMTHV